MKKIFILYIVFLLTFILGDAISTFMVVQFKGEDAKPTLPDKCKCVLPPECDVSPAVAGSTSRGALIFAKVIMAVGTFLLLFVIRHRIYYFALLMFSIMGTFAVASNLSIYFWSLASYIMLSASIVILTMLNYFTGVDDLDLLNKKEVKR